MAKYSFEFKKRVVLAYLNGEGGQKFLAEKYGISSKSNLQEWISAYKELGDEGLIRSRKQNNYTYEYKLYVVELYITSELSYQELAIQEKITTPSLIARWVNDFRIAGPDALRPKPKGRKKTLNNPNIPKKAVKAPVNSTSTDTNTEYIKELENELLKLRIENAYLKELRRLRLEEQALLKKQRESSTVSEDSSN